MKKLVSLLIISTGLTISCAAKAQSDVVKDEKKLEAYLGLGAGLDYGGLGLRLELYPQPFISIFGGAGYNLNKVGFNLGTSIKFLSKKSVNPTLQLMYGYNAIANGTKTYYGPTIGAGVDVKFDKRVNKFFASINYPFRNSEFKNNNPDVIPLAFTIGYNFNLNP